MTAAQKKKDLKKGLSKVLTGFAKNFWRWDTSGDGGIDREEFRAAIKFLKLRPSDEETCNKVFDEIDFDGNGLLSQKEIVRYTLLDTLQHSRDRIWNLCKLWDFDNSQTLCLAEFHRIMEAMRIEVPAAVIDELFKDLDEDRTGEVSLGSTQASCSNLIGDAHTAEVLVCACACVRAAPATGWQLRLSNLTICALSCVPPTSGVGSSCTRSSRANCAARRARPLATCPRRPLLVQARRRRPPRAPSAA